jgi:transcriptional regulator with XRE-family HTH domain
MNLRQTGIMPRGKRGGTPPSDRSDKAVGKRQKLLRLAFGKTQEDIAKLVGVSLSMISRCESGGTRLGVDHMLTLLIEFDVPLEYLYLGWKRHLSNDLRRKLDQVSELNDGEPSSS